MVFTNINIAYISNFLQVILSEHYRHEATCYTILCILTSVFSLSLYSQTPLISVLCYDLETNIRYEVFTMVKIYSGVFRVMTPCRLGTVVTTFWRSMLLPSVLNMKAVCSSKTWILMDYIVWCPRRPEYEYACRDEISYPYKIYDMLQERINLSELVLNIMHIPFSCFTYIS